MCKKFSDNKVSEKMDELDVVDFSKGIKSGLDLGVRLSEGFPVLNAGESVMLQPDMDGGRLYFVGIKNWIADNPEEEERGDYYSRTLSNLQHLNFNEKNDFDVTDCWSDQKLKMIPLTADGGVYKWKTNTGQDEPFDSSFIRGIAERFKLDCNQLLPGMEIIIKTMNQGETTIGILFCSISSTGVTNNIMADMYETIAWGKKSKDSKFELMQIERNLPGVDDVTFDLKFCGICHSDVHIANDDMGVTNFPVVPGHELAGVVTAVGSNVTKFKLGDKVGVGCISDSCMKCSSCDQGFEQACHGGMTITTDSKIKHGHIKTNSGFTFGGFSGSQTVNQRYLIRIPNEYPLELAGPVFCSALTMYSPLCQWKANGGGMTVGVIGIGGLGQMGIQLAKAMGNQVTAISTTPAKKPVALEIGADMFIVSSDDAQMVSGANTLDLILNTVSANHQIEHYLPLLRRNGAIVQLGLAFEKHNISQIPLIMKRLIIAGGGIGGIPETQECMDFCAKNKIFSKIKMVKASELDEVFATLVKKNDQVIRYVLDIEGSK